MVVSIPLEVFRQAPMDIIANNLIYVIKCSNTILSLGWMDLTGKEKLVFSKDEVEKRSKGEF